MSTKTKKTRYRVTNWSDYNQALIDRGNITLWFSEQFLSQWYHTPTPNRRGASNTYSDTAIECVLMLKRPLRATQALLNINERLTGP